MSENKLHKDAAPVSQSSWLIDAPNVSSKGAVSFAAESTHQSQDVTDKERILADQLAAKLITGCTFLHEGTTINDRIVRYYSGTGLTELAVNRG